MREVLWKLEGGRITLFILSEIFLPSYLSVLTEDFKKIS